MSSIGFSMSDGAATFGDIVANDEYVFTPSGLSSLQFPALPSAENKKVKFTFKNFSWPSAKGYIIYQGGSSSANREFGILSVNGDLSITVGGRTVSFLYMSIAFGLPTRQRPKNVDWELTIESNGTIISVVDGVEVARSGQPGFGATFFTVPTMNRDSYTRLEGAPFRIGARSDNNTPTTEETGYQATTDERIGDTLIEYDDIVIRDIKMPATSNLPIVDAIDSANNGKLLLGTGDDFARPNLRNYVANYSMFVPNGTSNCHFPTLGAINGNKFSINLANVTWLSESGYLFGQVSATASEREIGLFGAGGGITIVAGGTETNIGSYTQVFGLSSGQKLLNANVLFTLEINGDFEISVDGRVTETGNISRGASRLDGCLFRIGARNNSTDITDTEGFYTLSTGDKVGNFSIEINDTQVRNVEFPVATRKTILDTLSSANNGGIDGGSLTSLNTVDFSWQLPRPKVDSVAAFNTPIKKVVVIGASINDQSSQIPTTGFVRNYIFNKYGIEVEFFDRSVGGWTTPRINAESGATFKEFERQEDVVVLVHTGGNDGNEGQTFADTNASISNLSVAALNELYDKAHSYGFHLIQTSLTFRNYGFDTLDASGDINDIVNELGGSYTWTRDWVVPIMRAKAPYLLGKMQNIDWPKIDMYNAVRNVHATFRRSPTDTRHPDVWGQFYMLGVQTEGAIRLSLGQEPFEIPRRDYTQVTTGTEVDVTVDLTTDDLVLLQPQEMNPLGSADTFKGVVYDNEGNLLSDIKVHTNTTNALSTGLGNLGDTSLSLANHNLLTGVHRYVNSSSFRENQPLYFYIHGFESLKAYDVSAVISVDKDDTELKLQIHDDTPKFDLPLYDHRNANPAQNIVTKRVVSDFQGGFLIAAHEFADNGGGGESYLSGVRVQSAGVVDATIPTLTASPNQTTYTITQGDTFTPPSVTWADDGNTGAVAPIVRLNGSISEYDGAVGNWTFTYNYNDGINQATPIVVSLEVQAAVIPNTPPTAIINAPTLSNAGQQITLDGSVIDSDIGDSHTFKWRVIEPSSGVSLSATDTQSVTLTSPILSAQSGVTVGLIVNDGTVDSEEATHSISVSGATPPNNNTQQVFNRLLINVDLTRNNRPNRASDLLLMTGSSYKINFIFNEGFVSAKSFSNPLLSFYRANEKNPFVTKSLDSGLSVIGDYLEAVIDKSDLPNESELYMELSEEGTVSAHLFADNLKLIKTRN